MTPHEQDIVSEYAQIVAIRDKMQPTTRKGHRG